VLRDFYADFSIVIIYIEIVLLWEVCFYFIMTTFGDRRKAEFHNNVNYSMYAFFLCYSFYKLFGMIYIYYSMNPLDHLISRISLVLGAVLFIIIVNRYFFKQIFKSDKNRLIFVGILLSSTIVFVALYFYYLTFEMLIILLIALAILVGFIFHKSIKWFLKLGRIVRTYVSIFALGCILFIAGASFSRLILYSPSLQPFALLFYTIETAGIILIAIGAWKSPKLSELDWKSKILALYIIEPSGICIFKHLFQDIETMDPLLIGGGITGIIKMVKEMTKSEHKLSNIKQANKNILLEYGNYVTVALLTVEELEILRYKLKILLINFEEFFRDVLPDWKNDLTKFMPAKVLVEKIFNQ